MAPALEVVASERDAAQRGAEKIAAAGRAAVEERGSFSLAMSGGRSPWAMLAILSDREDMPWDRTALFQVDERIASPGSEERNLTHMVLGLSMDHQASLRPMPVTQRDLEAAAREYEETLPEQLDLTAAAMRESPDLSDFGGRVSDSGEGRWTSIAAIDEGVPAPVLTAALYERFYSRGLDDFGDKVLSAMRKQFGGHDEKK